MWILFLLIVGGLIYFLYFTGDKKKDSEGKKDKKKVEGDSNLNESKEVEKKVTEEKKSEKKVIKNFILDDSDFFDIEKLNNSLKESEINSNVEKSIDLLKKIAIYYFNNGNTIEALKTLMKIEDILKKNNQTQKLISVYEAMIVVRETKYKEDKNYQNIKQLNKKIYDIRFPYNEYFNNFDTKLISYFGLIKEKIMQIIKNFQNKKK